jgi:hypothetical protein
VSRIWGLQVCGLPAALPERVRSRWPANFDPFQGDVRLEVNTSAFTGSYSKIRVRNPIFADRTVRELEHAIDRALVMRVADRILPDDLPAEILEMVPTEPGSSDKHDKCQSGVKEPKKQMAFKAMQQCSGNYIEAAKMLGLHPNSLLRLVRNPGLKGIASEAHGAHDRF